MFLDSQFTHSCPRFDGNCKLSPQHQTLSDTQTEDMKTSLSKQDMEADTVILQDGYRSVAIKLMAKLLRALIDKLL